MHHHRTFVANRNGLGFVFRTASLVPVLDPQERPGGNDIIATIKREGLERRTRIRAFLDFIQENQRPARNQLLRRVIRRDLLVQVLRLQASLEEFRRIRLQYEIEGQEAFIILAAKFLDDIRLSNLASPLDKQTLLMMCPLPVDEIVIEFSPQFTHNASRI